MCLQVRSCWSILLAWNKIPGFPLPPAGCSLPGGIEREPPLNAQRLAIERPQEAQRQRPHIRDVQQPGGGGISDPAGES